MKLKLFLSFLVLSVYLTSVAADTFCYKSHLKELRKVIGGKLNENVDESQNECEDIIKKLINFVSRHRNTLKKNFKNDESELARLSPESKNILREREETWLELQKYQTINTSDSDTATCSVSTSNGKRMIGMLEEIYDLLIKSTTSKTDDNCQMVKYIIKVDDFVAHRTKQRDLINKTLDVERNSPADLETVQSDIRAEIEQSKNSIIEEQKEFTITSLQKGYSDGYSNLIKMNDELASEVIKEAYNCKEENLLNIVKSLVLNNKMITKVVEEMKSCNAANSSAIIYIQSVTKDDAYNELVDEAYEQLGNPNEKELIEKISKFRDLYGVRSLDAKNLIGAIYKCDLDNFEKVLNFINEIKIQDKKIENVFYDKFIDCNHTDTKQHVEFAFWLEEKIKEANYNADLIRKRPELKSLRERLPEGIELLVFGEYVIFAQDGFEQILRARDHVAVKFKYEPSRFDNGTKVYGLRDIDNSKHNQLSVTYQKSTKLYRSIIAGGKPTEWKEYQWEIIPTNSAKRFFLYHPFYNVYLSNEEVISWGEHYNLAFKNNDKPDQKWMITNQLIRNKPLDDRSDKIGKLT